MRKPDYLSRGSDLGRNLRIFLRTGCARSVGPRRQSSRDSTENDGPDVAVRFGLSQGKTSFAIEAWTFRIWLQEELLWDDSASQAMLQRRGLSGSIFWRAFSSSQLFYRSCRSPALCLWDQPQPQRSSGQVSQLF